jgi:hypothetical protein
MMPVSFYIDSNQKDKWMAPDQWFVSELTKIIAAIEHHQERTIWLPLILSYDQIYFCSPSSLYTGYGEVSD